ncbi:MAG: phosphatidate cytidylyltransferase, partial [bacterium]
GISVSFVLLLQGMLYHELGVVMLFVLVFGMDTAAYFVGKQFGGAKLFPILSPNKTISGAVGGLIFAILLSALFPLIPEIERYVPAFAMHINWPQAMLIGLTIGIVGQLGDLMESAFKRWGGVKDSGAALPGHGGYLDRFDSLFLAAPVCYVLFLWLVK